MSDIQWCSHGAAGWTRSARLYRRRSSGEMSSCVRIAFISSIAAVSFIAESADKMVCFELYREISSAVRDHGTCMFDEIATLSLSDGPSPSARSDSSFIDF